MLEDERDKAQQERPRKKQIPPTLIGNDADSQYASVARKKIQVD
jgi:hypothetical protein